MIWKFDYVSLYLSVRKNLTYKNINNLTQKQIDHIGRLYNRDLFSHYKKTVFFRWFYENLEDTSSFSKKAKKLIKKLNIKLADHEMEKINNIEPREFTKHRALKKIEVPYKINLKYPNLDEEAYFFYKNIRLYEFNRIFFKQKHRGEIYITKNELVFYDRVENEIIDSIKYTLIKEIKLKSYGIEIKKNNSDSFFVRYKDNELIYISIMRVLPSRKNVNFSKESKDEFVTFEKTIEAILDVK